MSQALALVPSDATLSPARKAWATRRARAAAGGLHVVPAIQPTVNAKAAAIAAFERAAGADLPDWHAVALAMKRAILAEGAAAPRIRTAPQPRALPAPKLEDHPVTNFRALQWPAPTIVCRFADGEIVRMSFSSMRGKPIAIARGLRLAIAAYRARLSVRRFGRTGGRDSGNNMLLSIIKMRMVEVPAFETCSVEGDNGQTIGVYDLDLVNRETVHLRGASHDEA